MDPFTIAALTYVSTKIGEKIFDKALEKGHEISLEQIVSKKTFNSRLRVIIQNTADEFKKGRQGLFDKMFPFENSELLFAFLIENNVYNNKNNPLAVDKFLVNDNIVRPEQEQLDIFFEMFMENIFKDSELRKLYVEENYKEAIFEIGKNISHLKDTIDQVVKNTEVDPQLLKGVRSNKILDHSFSYQQRTSMFVGREKEIDELLKFFFSDNNFCWWAITGRGGVGKSRLALELCLELENLNVNCGFLPIQQMVSLNWNNWFPKCPHLFVIDLAASNYEKIIAFISYLANRDDFQSPVKVLLIDRNPDEIWWKELMQSYDCRRCCFSQNSCSVNGLKEKYFLEIVENILKEKEYNVKVDPEILIEIMKRIDPFQRPLFAMFVGVAIANGQHIRDWNQYNLLDYQLDYEFNNVLQRFSSYDQNTIYQHKNLLILATLCYGLNQIQLDEVLRLEISWLPSANTLDFELYEALSGQSDVNAVIANTGYVQPNKNYLIKDLPTDRPSNISPNYIPPIVISPLIPDVIGEYFVLKNIGIDSRYKFRDLDRFGRLKELANELHGYYYGLFVRNILHDFPIHNNVVEFLKENTGGIVSNKGINGQAIIEFMQNVYIKDGIVLQKLWEYTREIEIEEEKTTVETKLVDDPHRVFQHSTWIMLWHYQSDIEKVLYYYDIMLANTIKFSKKEKVYVLTSMSDYEWTRILSNKGFESPDAERDYIDDNKVVSELIPHLEALAIEFIIKLPESGKLDDVKKGGLLKRLFELAIEYRDIRIKNLLLSSWLAYGPSKIGQFDEKIKQLYQHIKSSKKQLDPINAEKEKISFIKMLINDYLILDKDIQFYFEDLLAHFLSQNPSRNIAFGLIEMAALAYSICEKYYDKHDLNNGDIFHLRIDRIANVFLPDMPSRIMNLKEKAVAKRVETVKDMVNL